MSESHLFQSRSQLVRTTGGLGAAADALQTGLDILGFHTADEGADALQVTVATTHKTDILHTAVVIDIDVYLAAAGALSDIAIMLHHQLVLSGFHIGVHVLHIIKLLELLYHLVDGLTLFGSNVLEVVGDTGKLGAGNLVAILLEIVLDVAKALGVAI